MKTRANKGRQSPTPRLSDFAKRLLAAWKELGLPLTKVEVILAASGGADSTALLLALEELIKKSKREQLRQLAGKIDLDLDLSRSRSRGRE